MNLDLHPEHKIIEAPKVSKKKALQTPIISAEEFIGSQNLHNLKNYLITDSHLEDVKESKIHAISFFSGAGGLDIGAQLAKAKIISSHDFDKDSIATLSKNKFFNHTHHNLGDISKADAKSFNDVIKNNNPEKLILIGGPPCQPFSKAGYWLTLKNRLSHDDPRNMIGHYLRMVEDLQPNGFILENVESLLHPHNAFAVESLVEAIESLGYKHRLIRANAADYGVPQKRKRVFFICSKIQFRSNEPDKTHGNDKERHNNSCLLPHESVFNWIGKYNTEEFFEKEETAEGKYYEDLILVPPGKNYIALTERAGFPNPKFIAGKRYWTFLLKLHPGQPSWTIISQPGHWEGPFHWTSRRLRVPELAAIQTFPENYLFSGSRRSIQKQIGNAVPPVLGKAMVNFLMQNI